MARSTGKEGKDVQVFGSGQPEESTGEISRKLRALYDSVQEEAIPEHLLDLLEKLDQVEQGSGAKRK